MVGLALAGGAALAGAASSGLSAAWSAKSAAKAWSRQKTVLKNQVQWKVQDVEKAGLNKYLAVTGGLSGGGGSVPMAAQVDFSKGVTSAKDVKKLGPEMTILRNNATRSAHDAEAAGYISSSAKDVSIRNGLETQLAIERRGYEKAREGLREDTAGAVLRGARNFINQRNNPVSRRDAARRIKKGVKTIKGWFNQ